MNFLTTAFYSLFVLLILDFLWLGVVAKNFYQKHLGNYFSESFKLWPAALFYPLYACGITVFVVLPSLRAGKSSVETFLLGAFLGVVAYGTYNLTNLSTINNWPIVSVLVDMFWGGFVSGTVALAASFLMKI